jgi:hypothetical protein
MLWLFAPLHSARTETHVPQETMVRLGWGLCCSPWRGFKVVAVPPVSLHWLSALAT